MYDVFILVFPIHFQLCFKVISLSWVTKNIDFKTLYFVINNLVGIINTIQYNQESHSYLQAVDRFPAHFSKKKIFLTIAWPFLDQKVIVHDLKCDTPNVIPSKVIIYLSIYSQNFAKWQVTIDKLYFFHDLDNCFRGRFPTFVKLFWYSRPSKLLFSKVLGRFVSTKYYGSYVHEMALHFLPPGE